MPWEDTVASANARARDHYFEEEKRMAKRGKKYLAVAQVIEKNKLYDPAEAIALLKEHSKANFDQTVEVAVRLGVDPRHADQQVRGTVVLPHGTGKVRRVLVFAKGEKAKEAEAAGADGV